MSEPGPTGQGRVRRVALIIGAIGLVIAAVIIVKVGLPQIVTAFVKIGWIGLGALCVTYLIPVAILATAWQILDPKTRLREWFAFYLARLVRDASGELLPFSSLGGFVFGARTAMLGGVDPAIAISTTVVDVTAEFIGQLGFTALGLALLAYRPEARLENEQLLQTSLLGLGAAVVAAVVFVLIQRRASLYIERAVARWAPSALAQTSAVTASLHSLYQKPARLTASSLLHFVSWIVAAVGVWAALWVAGQHESLRAILGLESLIYSLRSIGFAAPMGLGVIEGGYVFVGPLFGLPQEFCLALSLMKRARDIIVGVPAMALWQFLEGRQMMAKAKAAGEAPKPSE